MNIYWIYLFASFFIIANFGSFLLLLIQYSPIAFCQNWISTINSAYMDGSEGIHFDELTLPHDIFASNSTSLSFSMWIRLQPSIITAALFQFRSGTPLTEYFHVYRVGEAINIQVLNRNGDSTPLTISGSSNQFIFLYTGYRYQGNSGELFYRTYNPSISQSSSSSTSIDDGVLFPSMTNWNIFIGQHFDPGSLTCNCELYLKFYYDWAVSPVTNDKIIYKLMGLDQPISLLGFYLFGYSTHTISSLTPTPNLTKNTCLAMDSYYECKSNESFILPQSVNDFLPSSQLCLNLLFSQVANGGDQVIIQLNVRYMLKITRLRTSSQIFDALTLNYSNCWFNQLPLFTLGKPLSKCTYFNNNSNYISFNAEYSLYTNGQSHTLNITLPITLGYKNFCLPCKNVLNTDNWFIICFTIITLPDQNSLFMVYHSGTHSYPISISDFENLDTQGYITEIGVYSPSQNGFYGRIKSLSLYQNTNSINLDITESTCKTSIGTKKIYFYDSDQRYELKNTYSCLECSSLPSNKSFFTTYSPWSDTCCDQSCRSCFGPSSNDCLTCYNDILFQSSSNSCSWVTCSQSTYLNKAVNECKPCDSSCETCKGPANTDCLTCTTNHYYDNILQTCYPCNPKCKTCKGNTTNDCLSLYEDNELAEKECDQASNWFIIDLNFILGLINIFIVFISTACSITNFWMWLSTNQLIYFMNFINVNLPNNLNEFLSNWMFSLMQFAFKFPITMKFSIQLPDIKFLLKNINSYFFANSSLSVAIITMSLSLILILELFKHKFSPIRLKFGKKCSIKKILRKICLKIYRKLKWNFIFRYITTIYQMLCLYCYLQIKYTGLRNIFEYLSYITGCFILIGLGFFPIWSIYFIKKHKNQILNLRFIHLYGILYSDYRTNNIFRVLYSSFFLLWIQGFVGIVVMIYSNPLIVLLTESSFLLIMVIFLIVKQPYIETNMNMKAIASHSLIFFSYVSLIGFLFLEPDTIWNRILEWIIIVFLILITIIDIIYMYLEIIRQSIISKFIKQTIQLVQKNFKKKEKSNNRHSDERNTSFSGVDLMNTTQVTLESLFTHE